MHVQKVVRNCGAEITVTPSQEESKSTSHKSIGSRMPRPPILAGRKNIEVSNSETSESNRAGKKLVTMASWSRCNIDAIDGTIEFDWSEHLVSLYAASVSRHGSVNSLYEEKLHLILDQFPDAQCRAIKRAVEGGISHWLTTITLERYHFAQLNLEMLWL